MKRRDRYLTGILLILVGILIGTILTVYQQDTWINDHAEVKVTEVRESDRPAYSSEELEQLDPRFLFKSVAERITPTVVYIETVISANSREQSMGEDDEPLWDRFVPRRARTVGSGVIITEDGYILTNNHVVKDAVNDGIQVVLNDKRVFDARLVGADSSTDLAVLKIDARNLPAVIVGDSDKVEVGEWVLAIGNPFRLRSTVTAGIVSALSRDVQVIDVDNQLRIESFIQTDAAINRGNSGGALVNTSGELVGINTAIASQTGNYQGYGFAVPSNLAGKVARDIIQYGEVRRALLGVSIRGVNAYRAEDLGMESIRGVEIMSVSPEGAAAEQGLQPHDVILSVNGSKVNESNELQQKIAVLPPGKKVMLKIWREGAVIDKEIRLGMLENDGEPLARAEGTPDEEGDRGSIEQDKNIEQNSEPDYGQFALGFRAVVREGEEGSETSTIVIADVVNQSEAARRGLKEGYVIEKVEDQEVEDLQTLKDLVSRSLEENQTVNLQIRKQDGATGFYQLKQQ